MEVYRAESALIMQTLREVSPILEKVSVDEAYLDVSAAFADAADQDSALSSALSLAKQIKSRIADERSLSASIGIASNKFLAKLGSDFQKPNGLTLIPERDKVAFLRELPVTSIHGVGPVTAQSLHQHGLVTMGDIQDTNLNLGRLVGSFASKLKERAFGNDDRPVDPDEERKSISAENTFLEDTEDRGILREVLNELARDIAGTLAQHAVGALTVQIKVRYSDFTTLTRQIRVEEPLITSREIYRLACFLLARDRLVKKPLRLIGIGVSTLISPNSRQQLRLPI